MLCGRRLLNLPDSLCYNDPEEEYGLSREHLALWQTEYLLELRDSHRYTSDKSSVSVGDVVLVYDTTPRGFWLLAKVTNFVSGQDGCQGRMGRCVVPLWCRPESSVAG